MTNAKIHTDDEIDTFIPTFTPNRRTRFRTHIVLKRKPKRTRRRIGAINLKSHMARVR